MNDPPHSNRPWLWPTVIGLLALVASLGGIANEWAQDDIPLIWKNPAAHDLKGLVRAFTDSYWPRPFTRSLYRPFASSSFIFQWIIGGGDPLAFRLVSYFLYAFASVGVFTIARIKLPTAGAAAIAALFAVHPIHVEAVAVAVNQSELSVGLLACLMVALYVRERSRTGPLSTKHLLLQAGLFLVACLFKENALIIPGLLVAAEVLLVSAGEPIRVRLAYGRRLLLLLMLVAVTFYYVRTRVLGGNLAGTFVAEHLVGLSMGGRAIAMLAVVPQWFRLLFWPAHLRADYGPGEFVAQTTWGWNHTLGLMLLAGSLVLAVACWRRAPLVTFGIGWCAIALFPVSNVLMPTGILLAERTLFLPSVGAMLALGALAMILAERATPRARLVLAGLFGAALVAGMIRSNSRHPVWHDQFGLWYKTANEDAPRSFRAHEALAEAYFLAGLQGMGEQEFQLAIQFAPVTMLRPRMSYADKLRRQGACYRAAAHYRTAVEVEPRHMPARAGLIACLLDLGRYREAMLHARMGISFGWMPSAFQQALRTADSALRVSAPAGTVRVKVPRSDISSSFIIDEKP
jgi:hypothetical protein